MRKLTLLLASLFFASALLGCPLLKKKKGLDDLGDAATVTIGGTGAKNEKDVLRYANEEKIDEPAVIGKDNTVARNFPGNGPEVAKLSKGTIVNKMAKYFSTGVLVMFDDPTTADGTKLMGWVPVEAFDVAAPKPVWTAPKVVDGGARPSAVDAGAKADAGGSAPPAADAGGGNAAADAGGGGGSTAHGPPAVAPVNGKCVDANRVLAGGMCRFSCATDATCPRGLHCKAVGGPKVCTAD